MVTPTLYFPKKRPIDVAPFTCGFTDWLDARKGTLARDSITGATVATSDPALVASGAVVTGDNVTTELSGGTAGNVYTVTFTITTARGITKQQLVLIQVV